MSAKANGAGSKDVAVGLGALAGVLMVGLLFVLGVARVLGTLESQVAAAVAAASATVIASVVAIILSKRMERRSAIAQDIRSRKAPAYEALVGILFQFMFAEKSGRKKLSTRDLLRVFVDLNPKLLVWGSQDVIRAWVRIREHDWQNAPDQDGLILWNDLLLAIRKDLGNETNALGNRELIRMFISIEPDGITNPIGQP